MDQLEVSDQDEGTFQRISLGNVCRVLLMDQKSWSVAMKRSREALTVMEVQTVFAVALGIFHKVHGYQDNGKHDSHSCFSLQKPALHT